MLYPSTVLGDIRMIDADVVSWLNGGVATVPIHSCSTGSVPQIQKPSRESSLARFEWTLTLHISIKSCPRQG